MKVGQSLPDNQQHQSVPTLIPVLLLLCPHRPSSSVLWSLCFPLSEETKVGSEEDAATNKRSDDV